MQKSKRVVAVLPAYNASRTLGAFLDAFPREAFHEILLVDDCSRDDTYALARARADVVAVRNTHNLGYGGNMKRCLSLALARGADVIAEIHPDGEYDAKAIFPALRAVRSGARLVLGDRFSPGVHALRTGMRWWKYPATRLLTTLGNLVLGTRVGDLHQGFRVYTRELLETVNLRANSDSYAFSIELIAQAAAVDAPIASVPVATSYRGAKRGASFAASMRYALATVRTLFLFVCARLGARAAIFRPPGATAVCPNCDDAALTVPAISVGAFGVFFCHECRNAFTNPVPPDIARYYAPAYWHSPGILGWVKRVTFRLCQRRREAWVRHFLRGGRILDVGAGEAAFGSGFGDAFRVTSLDTPSSGVVSAAVLKTDFLRWRQDDPFDAVVFWESLEHVPHPERYLKHAWSLLAPGGLLFVEYPRFRVIESRLFGRHWFHLDLPRHLAHFTDEGIGVIASRAGFTQREARGVLAPEYAPWGLLVSAAAAGRLPIRRFHPVARAPLLLPLLLLGLIPAAGVELLLFLAGASPIGLFMARKNPRAS